MLHSFSMNAYETLNFALCNLVGLESVATSVVEIRADKFKNISSVRLIASVQVYSYTIYMYVCGASRSGSYD